MRRLHVGDFAGEGWHEKLRPFYKGVYFAGMNFTKESGAELLARGLADAIVYGVKFLANPHLPESKSALSSLGHEIVLNDQRNLGVINALCPKNKLWSQHLSGDMTLNDNLTNPHTEDN